MPITSGIMCRLWPCTLAKLGLGHRGAAERSYSEGRAGKHKEETARPERRHRRGRGEADPLRCFTSIDLPSEGGVTRPKASSKRPEPRCIVGESWSSDPMREAGGAKR